MSKPKKFFTYLIVADESEEFENALRYAARTTKAHGAKLAVLLAMPEQGFLHWSHVETRMKQEQRTSAERFILQVADRIRQISDITPSFYLEEGEAIGALTKIMNDNTDICKLILGANTHATGVNPLIDYFTGKGIARLPVPIMIVPDHIAHEKIDELA